MQWEKVANNCNKEIVIVRGKIKILQLVAIRKRYKDDSELPNVS